MNIDIDQIRRDHPIAIAVADAGVDLRRSGRGRMGRCPFHEDRTASLSVDGVPDRFHCCGCGAHGDVIDFIKLRYGVNFLEAIATLEHHHPTAHQMSTADRPDPGPGLADLGSGPSALRALEINDLAWRHFIGPVAHAFAESWLRHHRGIDIGALEPSHQGRLVGHTGHGWTSLTQHLLESGVTPAELVAMDLARPTRRGNLIDTFRDRLILLIRDSARNLTGFVGRDTGTAPGAPKYRNPTRTPTFAKATALYWPTGHHASPVTIVVEGPLDALALSAAAATVDRACRYAPVSALGAHATQVQIRAVLTQTTGDLVIALDGDPAGRTATTAWLQEAARSGRPCVVAELPDGVDPADWIARRGPTGLFAFDPVTCDGPGSLIRGIESHGPATFPDPPARAAYAPSIL